MILSRSSRGVSVTFTRYVISSFSATVLIRRNPHCYPHPLSSPALHKKFVRAALPLIITEGRTDPVYLKAAIERRTLFHPKLGRFDAGKFKFALRFMNFPRPFTASCSSETGWAT
jgi:hypothetical protein